MFNEYGRATSHTHFRGQLVGLYQMHVCGERIASPIVPLDTQVLGYRLHAPTIT